MSKHRHPVSLITVLLLTFTACAQSPQPLEQATPQAMHLGQWVDQLKPAFADDVQLQAMVATARQILHEPIIKRVDTYQQLCDIDPARQRKLTHSRPDAIKHPVIREYFARATSDQESANLIVSELPYLAACYRLTGDQAFADYITRQLTEVATWIPLQRPGWSMPHSGRTQMPEGGDGVWLATGIGIRAVVYTRELLGKGVLPDKLEKSLDLLLKTEMNRTFDDWQAAKPWYVRDQKYQSNQWVIPNEGLMLAACALGKDKYPSQYALARENLFKTMSTLGDEGANSEGFTYALGLTLLGVQSSAMAMAQVGDFEAVNNPFLQKYGKWLISHYQPGEYLVNDFDGYGACRGMYDRGINEKIAQLAVLSGDKALLWALAKQHKQLPHSLFGMLATAMLKETDSLTDLPTHYQWDIARVMIWRSSWADSATGLWVRGSHPGDFHAHHDAGHVNFIVGGQAALIEAGTSGYRNPRLKDDYQSVRGHNVLQVDDQLQTQKGTDIPITVSRLTNQGGELSINPAAAYPDIASWDRHVAWGIDEITVSDQVATQDKQQHELTLRYLLGSNEPVTITPLDSAADGYAYQITIRAGKQVFSGWPGKGKDYWIIPDKDVLLTPAMTIKVQSPMPITVKAIEHVNHTMRFRFQGMPCKALLIQSQGKVSQMDLTMHMQVSPNDGK